jgi:uncharacterized membrane protein YphA (DoxX/SURF4 family)
MRKTYRAIASTIAILVVVQAMMIVWSVAGLFSWIDAGNTLDKSVVEGWADEPPTFDGAIGHFIHAFISGTVLIPLLGLILLIVSFFAKVPRGVALAAAIVVSIAVQWSAGTFAEPDMPYLGLVHGLNAFILFGLAVFASRSAKEADMATPAAPAAAV